MIDVGRVVATANADVDALVISLRIPIGVGNSVAVFATHGFDTSPWTLGISDDRSNTWTERNAPGQIDVPDNQRMQSFYIGPSVTPGDYTITGTLTGGSGGFTFFNMIALEIIGAAKTGTVIAASGPGNVQANPGTGTDAITSGTAQTPAQRPCLIVATSQDTSTGVTVPDAGTGFTSVAVWNGASMRTIKKRITSGNVQATFTATGAGTQTYVTMMMAFAEEHPLLDVDLQHQTGPLF